MKPVPIPAQITPRGEGKTRETPRRKGVFDSKRMTEPHAVTTHMTSNLGEYSIVGNEKSP